jgi:hypothetical protein
LPNHSALIGGINQKISQPPVDFDEMATKNRQMEFEFQPNFPFFEIFLR